ncbi:fructosamine kinase PKL/CAK/FruK [Roridomyces roridus]|uniref:protein-ribulosamine 3-kinase n=1 Tax=Roridomyces roridus TaxID=1738132 RepID=A0AAD7FPX2_9AGAR|nr:fructosamine kinase PKL/CAK/FruK [Roridomyces roridus]
MSHIHKILLDQLHKLDDGADFKGSPPRITSSSGAQYFAKIGEESEAEQYAGEAESLKQIALAAPGLAPHVLATGTHERRPYMISEYKDLTSLSDTAARRLGKRLATELHQYKGPNGFGFEVPTYCGATRLENGLFDTWEACYSAMIGDLLSQLEKEGSFPSLCARGQMVRKEVIPKLLGPLVIQPVLLHGDLWSGNMGCEVGSGEPVIFDPASYFGHNEADLAIARIFGGVPKGFFETYHEHLPKTEPVDQYHLRGELYQLFHYLNHTLLFGGHYASSAQRKMDTLLSAGL